MSKTKSWKVIERVLAGKTAAIRSRHLSPAGYEHILELPDWFRQANEKEPDR